MPDQVRIELSVQKGRGSGRVSTTRPIAWSGDTRKHAQQIRDLVEGVVDSVLAALELNGDLTT